MRFIFCCLIAALYPCACVAAPTIAKRLTILWIQDERAATIGTINKVADYAKIKLGQVGVRIRAIKIIPIARPCPEVADLFSYFSRADEYQCYRNWLDIQPYKGLVHVIMPAVFLDGISWQAGMAVTCQLNRRAALSISNAIDFRFPTGEARDGVARILAVHELGHSVGSNHAPGGIMDPDAGSFAKLDNNVDPPWARQSIRDVRRCIGKADR